MADTECREPSTSMGAAMVREEDREPCLGHAHGAKLLARKARHLASVRALVAALHARADAAIRDRDDFAGRAAHAELLRLEFRLRRLEGHRD